MVQKMEKRMAGKPKYKGEKKMSEYKIPFKETSTGYVLLKANTTDEILDILSKNTKHLLFSEFFYFV